jgi:hypothetical protein
VRVANADRDEREAMLETMCSPGSAAGNISAKF